MDENREFITLTTPLVDMGATTIKALHQDYMEKADALLCLRATDKGSGFDLECMVAGSGKAVIATLSTTILEVSRRSNIPTEVLLRRIAREVISRDTKATLGKNLGSIFDALSNSLEDEPDEEEQEDPIEALAKKLKGRRNTNGY